MLTAPLHQRTCERKEINLILNFFPEKMNGLEVLALLGIVVQANLEPGKAHDLR
jgi:hypothetical protein